MTLRSIRRAAERKANKQFRKAEKLTAAANSSLENIVLPLDDNSRTGEACLALDEASEQLCFAPESETPPLPSISPAQLLANRANAQLSTGPKSTTGKSKSSLNAVKTGLTGRTVLLPSDDATEYERLLHAYENELGPMGQMECDLVLSIAEITWRLKRIPALEMAIFANGHLEFADSFDEHDPSLRPGMIELQTFMTYEKQLRNLQLQEARLARRREKEMAELRKLQSERKAKQVQALDAAAKRYLIAQKNNTAFDPAANGFEFSTAEIQHHLERCSPAWIDRVISEQGRNFTRVPPITIKQAA